MSRVGEMDRAFEQFILTLWRRINRHVQGTTANHEEIRGLLFEEIMTDLLERQIAAIRGGDPISLQGAVEEYRREFRRPEEQKLTFKRENLLGKILVGGKEHKKM